MNILEEKIKYIKEETAENSKKEIYYLSKENVRKYSKKLIYVSMFFFISN